MGDHQKFSNDIFRGLRALAESAFPKKCANCGRTFETAEQFLSQTRGTSSSASGLKGVNEEDGMTFVEAFRNCPCGSTLMEFFSDRRDLSAAGVRRRQKFAEVLDSLVATGMDHAVARAELLKVVHGETSELLADIRLSTSDDSGK